MNRRAAILLAPLCTLLGGCCFALVDSGNDSDDLPAEEDIVCDQQFLTLKGCGSDQEGALYYEAIDAEPTLDEWASARCFDQGGESNVFYINRFDLGFGRDMHCTECGLTIACYVTNYGAPGVSMDDALAARDAGRVAATVAMDYDPSRTFNRVRFYVYDGKGDLDAGLELDNEGEKFAPHVCLACHGGDYDRETQNVVGAAFLEFVPPLLTFPGGFNLDETIAIEAMRELVLRTDPPAPIARSVRGGSLEAEFVPEGWEGKEDLYGAVQRYCLGCHNAQSQRQFDTFAKFELQRDLITAAVFAGGFMPHAERTAALLAEDDEALALILGEDAGDPAEPDPQPEPDPEPECTAEICDGQDNDCNGLIDDAPECIEGDEGVCAGLPRISLFDEIIGSTEGSGAEHQGSCASTEGPEEGFVLSLGEGGTVCLSTAGSPMTDTVIYVRESCLDDATEIACNDDAVGTRAQLTLRAEAGIDYFVFVEGFHPREGGFVLTVANGACQ